MQVVKHQFSPAKILVVDDSEACLLLVKALLEKLGYECFCASTFLQACEYASEHKPQRALIDLVMPEGNGAILSAELHRRCPGIHTFVISADYPVDLTSSSNACGRFSGAIGKPVSLTGLRDLLGLPARQESPVDGLSMRLESLPQPQRAMFVQALLQDLDDVSILLSHAGSLTQYLYCVHRLVGIFAAAAVEERHDIQLLEHKLKQGDALAPQQMTQILEHIRCVSSRIRHYVE